VKLASRKATSAGGQRRDQRQHDWERAPPLRQVYPQLGLIRLELVFADATRPAPSPQSLTFYPAARAFFRVACPCFDCDGEFDLSSNVRELAPSAGPRQRRVSGMLQCQGMRIRDRSGSARCPVELQFQIGMSTAGGACAEPA
jgi:hypothetical protein